MCFVRLSFQLTRNERLDFVNIVQVRGNYKISKPADKAGFDMGGPNSTGGIDIFDKLWYINLLSN